MCSVFPRLACLILTMTIAFLQSLCLVMSNNFMSTSSPYAFMLYITSWHFMPFFKSICILHYAWHNGNLLNNIYVILLVHVHLSYTRVVPESRRLFYITRERYGLLQSNFTCEPFHYFCVTMQICKVKYLIMKFVHSFFQL